MLNKNTKLKKLIISVLVICCLAMQSLFPNLVYAAEVKATIYDGDEKVEEFENTQEAFETAVELGQDSSKKIKLDLHDNLEMIDKEIPKDCKLTIDLNNNTIRSPQLKFGKLFTVSGSLTVINTVPENAERNTSLSYFLSDDNGGVFNIKSGGSVTLKNLIISDCSSTKRGGAIYVPDGATLKVDKCEFNKVSSTDHGGAISINCTDKETEINNSTFNECSSEHAGGAINIFNGKVSLNNDTFYNCSSNTGGAISSYYPEYLRINQISITKCKAKGYGGGFFINGQSGDKSRASLSNQINIYDNEAKEGNNIYLGLLAYIVDAGISYDSKFDIWVYKDQTGGVIVKNATQGKVNRGIYNVKNKNCEFVNKTSLVAGDFAGSIINLSSTTKVIFIVLPIILILIILIIFKKKKLKQLEQNDKTTIDKITASEDKNKTINEDKSKTNSENKNKTTNKDEKEE